jgi:hypothetical protein
MSEETALATRDTQLSIQDYAERAIASGMYSDMKTAEQAVMKLIAGRELGLSPLFSLQKLLIVKGQVTCMGEVIVHLWQQQGYTWQRILYNRKGEDIELSTAEDKAIYGCGIILWSPQGKLLTKDIEGNAKPCTFDMDRATIAGLTSKDNWRNYPDRLLFYRAVAFTARDYTPGITGGMTSTEEMQDVVELQKAKVKPIATGNGVATATARPPSVSEECPLHPGCYFTENKWHTWTHPTDEKKNGKTVWCYKDKVTPVEMPPAQPQGGIAVSPEPLKGFKDQLVLAMKAAKYTKSDLLDHCKRHFNIDSLEAIPLLPTEDKAKLIKDLGELADLANAG